MSERSRPAALISVLALTALLVATAAAIALTQHLRDEGPVVSSTRIKKNKRSPGEYRVCFQLTRDDTVQVAVVDASGDVVRVLAQAAELSGSDSAPDTPKAGAHCFDWDRTNTAGQPVPPGVYRMQLRLQRADRVLTPGEHRTVGAKEPRA